MSRLPGCARLMYTYTMSGSEIAVTMGHSQYFSPLRDIHIPPNIPPAIRPATPMTPLRNPMSPLLSSSPPAARVSIRKSLPILPNCASGKRNSNKNSSVAQIPGFWKYVFMMSPKFPNTSPMFFGMRAISSAGLGIAFLW